MSNLKNKTLIFLNRLTLPHTQPNPQLSNTHTPQQTQSPITHQIPR